MTATPAPPLVNPAPATETPSPAAPRGLTTPQLLRALTAGLVALGVLTGALGLAGFLAYGQALSRAEHNAAQLVRVQQLQTDLLAADAQATNAFLVGGLEPADSRARYDAAIADTTSLIAAAADAQPADADALAALNDQVLDYAAAVEQARANNRQGFPVGAQYLRNASAQLRAEALPICAALITANVERTDDETGVGGAGLALGAIGLGVVALAGTGVTMLVVARRFHRSTNLGLLISAGCLLATVISGTGVFLNVSGRVADVRGGPAQGLTTAAAIRIAANDAKANESLTLIARGSGGAFQQAWQADAESIDRDLDGMVGFDAVHAQTLRSAWTGYTEQHEQVRTLDDGGRWDDAVALATATTGDSPNAQFRLFDDQLARYLSDASAATVSRLGGTQSGLTGTAIISMVLGIGAAAAAQRGLAVRLKEYR